MTFYGGVNEIGGNKILLKDGGTEIFLDFGQSFNYGSDYSMDWLSPRGITGLRDHFEFDLLPKIGGLYREELLEKTDLDYREPEIDGVFLSHAHFDHVDHISFIDKEIPIFCGESTLKFMKALEETSPRTQYGEHDYRTFRTGDQIEIGDIMVEPVHVYHSIPGSYGFVVQTSSCGTKVKE